MTDVRYHVYEDEVPDGLHMLGQLSSERLTYYLESQRDPIIGTQTKRCQFIQRDWGWEMSSRLPMKVDIQSSSNGLDIEWDQISESQAQSDALWRLSIGYFPTLLETSNDFSLMERLLESIWSYLNSNMWGDRSAWMTSLDHALAIRIRSMLTLKCLYDLEGKSFPAAAKLILINDIENILEDEVQFFPTNNHGAMVAVSLIHAAAVIPELDQFILEKRRLQLIPFAAGHLENILGSMFDEYGIAGENSPEYQKYWISLVTPVAKIISDWNLLVGSDSSFDVERLLESAKRSLLLFADENKRLLPIGDSHVRSVTSQPPAESNLISTKQGFAFWKHKGTFLTFNCGYSNQSHKHCDDSSITLTYAGKNLILDSGYYSHDWNDPKVIYTKSQNAHSGVFLKKLDQLHPGRLYWPGQERIQSSLSRQESFAFGVAGEVNIDDSFCIQRSVIARSDTHIELVDSLRGDFDEYGEAVSRFILPFGARISVANDSVEVLFEGVRMHLVFTGLDQSRQVTLDCGVTEPHYSGWVSPEFGELVPANCLEVSLPYNRQVVTNP